MKSLVLGITMLGLLLIGSTGRAAENEGMVLYLSLDEGVGDTTADLSGNENDGSLMGGAKWVQGKDKKALELDGEGGYIQVPYSDMFNITEAITLAVWIKPYLPFDPPWKAIINNREFGAEGSFLLQTSQTNGGPERVAEFALRLPVGYTYMRAVTLLTDDDFYHITATYDAKSSQMRIYVNGSLEETATPNQTPSGSITAPPQDGIFIGKDYGVDSPNWFGGIVDEVVIYNRALEEDEVKNLYDGKIKSEMLAVEPSGKLATTWAGIKRD